MERENLECKAPYVEEEWEDCPRCGKPVSEDGLSSNGCWFSEHLCELCLDSPCDGSCHHPDNA